MSKYTLKTQKNDADVQAFLEAVEDPVRKKDALTTLQIMKEVTKEKPVMWGKNIVGFGEYTYKTSSEDENTWMKIGFSPRKTYLSIYIMPGYHDFFDLLDKLGPHKTGKSCLNIKNLDNIHMPTLKKLITKGYAAMRSK